MSFPAKLLLVVVCVVVGLGGYALSKVAHRSDAGYPHLDRVNLPMIAEACAYARGTIEFQYSRSGNDEVASVTCRAAL